MKRNLYTNIACFIIVVVTIFTTFNLKKWKSSSVIYWDVTSYYAYLPATFIHNDLSLEFTRTDGVNYSADGRFWPQKTENGSLIIKTTMGMSFLYAPFFAIAHIYSKLTDFPSDGFSEPYEMFLCFSSIFYLFVGLFFLRKLLLKYFSDSITAITLISIVLGTNLFYYTTSEGPMSHAYSLAMISVFLYLIPNWYHEKSYSKSLAIGLLFGLIVLVRPVNILAGIPFLLYNVSSFNSLRIRLMELLKDWKKVLVIALCAFIVVLPQLFYWKILTGHWVYNSYIGEQFYFGSPKILEGLFSFRKGWLLYTPIMAFSLIGMLVLPKRLPQYKVAIPLLFIIFTYIVFSWWCWWYGGGYSIRTMIDIYGILAIPMAAMYSFMLKFNRVIRYSFFSLIVLLVGFSLFQTSQYRYGSIHYDGMTKEAYLNSFLNLKPKNEFWELIKNPDYEKARKGNLEYFLFQSQ